MSRTVSMTPVSSNRHRLLAPRLVFLVGTTSRSGERNIIPISNVTSVSTDPCQVIIAVYNLWTTCANLAGAQGFTLSLASKQQLDLVWKLGAKYSGYKSEASKMIEFAEELDNDFSTYGPVLQGALGWMELEIIGRPNSGKGNHQMVVGQCLKAAVDPRRYTEQLIPIGTPQPLMQWEHNHFSTAQDIFSIPYYKESDL